MNRVTLRMKPGIANEGVQGREMASMRNLELQPNTDSGNNFRLSSSHVADNTQGFIPDNNWWPGKWVTHKYVGKHHISIVQVEASRYSLR